MMITYLAVLGVTFATGVGLIVAESTTVRIWTYLWRLGVQFFVALAQFCERLVQLSANLIGFGILL